MKMKNPNILLIGAGNIGSRHLQGLAKVKFPLNIEVVDPSIDSLKLAEERFRQIPSKSKHQISFMQSLDEIQNNVDLAIIATSSNIRRKVTETLLKHSKVKFIIFEKLLFQKKDDYPFMEKLLKRQKIKAWVNCSMRVTPFYKNLKKDFSGKKIFYLLTGTRFGIATQAIHFIDHMAYLIGNSEFEVDTSRLDKKILKSKRPGFLELTGTLQVHFKNGSGGVFVDFSTGDAPITAEIFSDNTKALANETTRGTYIFKSPDWKVTSSKDALLFQSDMTNAVTEEVIKTGKCNLPTFSESAKIHLKLLEELLKFLNENSRKKYDLYPFT